MFRFLYHKRYARIGTQMVTANVFFNRVGVIKTGPASVLVTLHF